MKNSILIILTLFSFLTAAEVVNEIPYSKTDVEVPTTDGSICFDCFQMMIKKVSCRGEIFAIHYLTGGWTGSKFRSVCKWKYRNSIQACENDNDPKTMSCYFDVAKYYNVTRILNRQPVREALPSEDSDTGVQ